MTQRAAGHASLSLLSAHSVVLQPTSHHEGTNTLASARSTLLGHEGTRRKAKEYQVEFTILASSQYLTHADEVPPPNSTFLSLVFFVSLRDLKGYSELTLGYSCLRGEM